MKVVLGLDDFSPVNSRLDLLFKLKDRFPGFKVSMFTVPVDIKTDWGISLIRGELLEKIKENLNWIQIIPHGLTHEGSEMKRCDYRTFKYEIMPRIKQAFDKDKLPFVKGFKAPHWRWTEGVVKALDEEGWFGAIDRRQQEMLSPKKFYKYSHCLDELFSGDILKLHGHIYGTSNDLGKCFNSLISLPLDTEWNFVTDFLEDKI
jgi:hypothetical protein